MRILCKQTDSLVGYLCQWDNGDLQPAWLKDAMADVRYDPIDRNIVRSPLDQQEAQRKSPDPPPLAKAWPQRLLSPGTEVRRHIL